MERKIILTDDGSSSVFDDETGESYHSRFGAKTESEWIFIEAGYHFSKSEKNELSVFEVGFGTGLNALLTSIYAVRDKISIDYTAIEAFPLTKDITENLYYPELLNDPEAEVYFKTLHAGGNAKTKINNFFTFTLIHSKLENWKGAENQFDLVYFDAFSPEVQPELWTQEIFSNIFSCMKSGGTLVTYSCKGIVKRALKANGFIIEKLPGPKGKREILRALKPLI